MAWRVTPAEVEAVIRDYDSSIDLKAMILAANALTDKIDAADSDGELSATLLLEIERHLAAHVYDATDHEAASEVTGKSTTAYTGLYGKGAFDGTRHGKLAMALDITGYLARINEGRKKATAAWLGKRPSNQTDYVDRD
jgi:hypothetical protein